MVGCIVRGTVGASQCVYTVANVVTIVSKSKSTECCVIYEVVVTTVRKSKSMETAKVE